MGTRPYAAPIRVATSDQIMAAVLATGDPDLLPGYVYEPPPPDQPACGDATGTLRGVGRHDRAGQRLCDACREAKRVDARARYVPKAARS